MAVQFRADKLFEADNVAVLVTKLYHNERRQGRSEIVAFAENRVVRWVRTEA